MNFDSGGSAGGLHAANLQFVQCRFPLKARQSSCFLGCGATIHLENALVQACDTFFQGEYGLLRGQHVTVSQCNTLGYDEGSDSALYLTNSLLVAVTNWGNMTYTTNTIVRYATDPGGIFQTVGAGAYYLVDGSTNRNVGTTNINADLLAALRQKTTYPPVLLSNVTLTASTNLLPQVALETGLLGLELLD